MNKLLILPFSLLLLASCGGGSSETTERTSSQVGWNERTRNNMTSSIGIILPYIELDNIEFYTNTDLFQIKGEGNNDDFASYRQLLEVDFNYLITVNNLDADPVDTFESKILDKAVRIELELYSQADGTGMEIDYFLLSAYRYVSWPSVELEALGISNAPQYDGDNKLGIYTGSSSALGDYVTIHVFLGSADSYTETLTSAGFITGSYGNTDDWDGQYDYLNYAYEAVSDTFIQYFQNGGLGAIIRIFKYDYNPEVPSE